MAAGLGEPTDTTGGVNPAVSGLDATADAGATAAAADLPQAQAGYDALGQKELANLGEQFQQPAPKPVTNPLGRLFPLLAISAFGGKLTKQDAGLMLASTTGLVKGYLAGNEEVMQQHEAAYQEAYKRFKDRQEQQDKIFKEMREAYKGRVDADVKALQFARQVTHDETMAANASKVEKDRWDHWVAETARHTEGDEENRALKMMQIDIQERKLKEQEKANDAVMLDEKSLPLAVAEVEANPAAITQWVRGYPRGQGQKVANQIHEAVAADIQSKNIKPEDLIAGRAVSKGEQASIVKLVGQDNAITTFEKLAKFNGDRVLALVDKTGLGSDVKLVEGTARMVQAGAGSEDVAEFQSVLNSFQIEAARILNNPSMTGVLTDTARTDLQHVINGDMTAGQLKRVIPRLYAEMDARHSAISGQIDEAKTKLVPHAPSASGAPTIDDLVKKYGGG